MPWSEINKMDMRYAAVREFRTGKYAKTEIVRIHGVDRKTLAKWVDRFEQEGQGGLKDRSSRPKRSPNALPKDIVSGIILENRLLKPLNLMM